MINKLVLASASPRRQELLRLVVNTFTVCPADADETLPAGLAVVQQIETLARRKAEAVFHLHPACAVIGSDTMVVLDGRPLGKPRDENDAKDMLRQLSGRMHEVITGLSVLSPHGQRIGHRVTRVHFRALTEKEINQYVATGEPMDKAGAYGIQGRGATMITGIEGDYFSVVGLPVELLYRFLTELGLL